MLNTQSHEIQFLQNNVARNQHTMVTCFEIGIELEYDFILFQEPWIAPGNHSHTISHPAYNTILPDRIDLRPRVAIFHRKLSRFQFCPRSDLCLDSDMLVIDILGTGIPDLQLINIYNEQSLHEDTSEWTVDRVLLPFTPSRHAILGGDMNAHHSWWNSHISSPIRADTLVTWLTQQGFDLLSQPDQSTFYREGMVNQSIIDLVFISQGLGQRQLQWEIDPTISSGSDHEILLYSIPLEGLVENPLTYSPYNLKKADWEGFSKKLLDLDRVWPSQLSPYSHQDNLEKEANQLQNIIQKAAENTIPRRKTCSRSKAWWNDELTSQRKTLGIVKRRWKQSQDPQDYQDFLSQRNIYFQEIKTAKSSCWNSFLENAQDKEIFKAFDYTKQKQVQRLPLLKYQNQESRERTAVSFTEKAQALFTTLFQKPPDSEPIDWSTYQAGDWEWPKIVIDEVREAIFTSSIKKAPGPDGISFMIIQKAYMNLPHRFYRLYEALIQEGYHPRCWKTAKGVVLKKAASAKRDYSRPKAYRIISLLNCLGKVSEKILARRLAYMAELPGSSLLHHDQMGGRRQKSAVDAVLSLVHDIQIAKRKREYTSTLFIDVKGAFDHVSINQLLRVCSQLGLPLALIRWIQSFLSDRSIQLAFDGDSTKETPVSVGIPQGSPISPILFLIYIRFLFDETEEEDQDLKEMISQVRFLSYIDDIALIISSRSLQENCQILEKVAYWLFDKGEKQFIQFDQEKIDLIHFHSKRAVNNEELKIRLTGFEVAPQPLVKWLGIYLDPKLLFHEHVKRKVCEATRVFHQIERLSNTERGLSFQAVRQLYIACITSVADYGVPVWWRGQRYLEDRYQKLQNLALRKILGAFKTSPYRAMEIEASLPPPRLRLKRICRSYALRTMSFNQSHAIQQRLPNTFTPNPGQFHLDRATTLDWTEQEKKGFNQQDQQSGSNYSDLDSRIRRRKLYPSQLVRVIASLHNKEWKREPESFTLIPPCWQPQLKDMIDIYISQDSKEKTAKSHQELTATWSQSIVDDKLIIYSDGSQSSQGSNGSGLFTTNTLFSSQDAQAWNIGKECEVFDAELYAIQQALQLALDRVRSQQQPTPQEIWIFSDSQAALLRLQGQANSQTILQIIENTQAIMQESTHIHIHIHWVPGHQGIYGNEKADEAAKYGAEWCDPIPQAPFSYSFLKRELKMRALQEWNKEWYSLPMGKSYAQFQAKPDWKPSSLRLPKGLWSTMQQLKLGHGYFKSYLVRLPDYDSDKCNRCTQGQRQSPYHLLMQCSAYQKERKSTIHTLPQRDQSLFYLFTSKPGQQVLLEYLRSTSIATRKWLLGTE